MVKGSFRKLCGSQVDQSVSVGRHELELNDKPNGPNTSSDAKYISWLEEHPSALTSFNSMMTTMEGKQIVVFLDYDGTLSPIVSDPDRAFMSNPVYGFVKLDEVYYAGSHGMDIMGPPKSYDQSKYQTNTLDEKGNEFTIFQPAKEYLPSINKMLKELKNRTCDVPGALVEDNRFCISVHYRHVLDEDYGMLEEIIKNVILEYHPCFHLTRGKKVLEIRPSIKWNKGDALLYLLDTLGFSDSNNVLPFYLGDDKTDEDAFKVLGSRGQGYPIIVSTTPRDTAASHSLRDPSDVVSFLLRLARWGSERDYLNYITDD
ncbi:hypothetical protein RD792_013792 [Penstemon davidsonii]|uniref:Trehalose 6-phosphate phosphatase n=1 Tax=Penstemon davidsonii TaxID=160366 RepID=A0ABR0CUY2_9LAMI|nr:hypothetical protein RD792_013792 [Penstemon davidsonii]